MQPGQEQAPVAGSQVPPLPQAFLMEQVGPELQGSAQMQLPSLAQVPPLSVQSVRDKLLQSSPDQQPLQAHVPVAQSQLPWPLQSRRPLVVTGQLMPVGASITV